MRSDSGTWRLRRTTQPAHTIHLLADDRNALFELGVVRGRSVPRPRFRLAVGGRQSGADLGEKNVQLRADDGDRGDANNCDQRGKQAVLDHGDAFFCRDELLNRRNEFPHFNSSLVSHIDINVLRIDQSFVQPVTVAN